VRGEHALILTRPVGEAERAATAAQLIDAIRVWDEKLPAGMRADGSLDYAAVVRYKRVVGQGVVYHEKSAVGFYEQFSPVSRGTLRCTDDGVELSGDDGAAYVWPWVTLRAVQTSGKSVQLNLRKEGLFDFRFEEDSPRRWEELIHARLQAHYRMAGLRVREFQPRILTVPIR
jgi:hypothetical protein